MIEQTISFAALTSGMARCVHEWILPAITDSWARLQAEQLAALLESLPSSFGPEAGDAILLDSAEAKAALSALGKPVRLQRANSSIDALMDENATLKRLLLDAADELRERDDEAARQALAEVQKVFMRSLGREMQAVAGADSFENLTSRDKGVGES